MVAHRLTHEKELEACSLYADEHRMLREVARVYGLCPTGVRRNGISFRAVQKRNSACFGGPSRGPPRRGEVVPGGRVLNGATCAGEHDEREPSTRDLRLGFRD